jgi:hypothetical protein
MDTKPAADRKGDLCTPPQPIVLTPSETKQVAGGINPQPLPPREDRPSAKSE